MGPVDRTASPTGRRLRRGALLASVLLAVPATAHATITVANTNDAGAGSLRQAIVDAASGETIVLPANTYTLTSGELAIAKSVSITGAGTAATIVRAGGLFRVVNTSGSTNTIALSDMTVRDGHPSGVVLSGGGIWNANASLSLTRVAVVDNHLDTDGAAGSAGGIGAGGGIASDAGQLTLRDSQVVGNTVSANGGAVTGATNGKAGGIVRGGGLAVTGALDMKGTTVRGNTAIAAGSAGAATFNGGPAGIVDGGGLQLAPGSAVAVVASTTFADNIVRGGGGPAGTGGAQGSGGTNRGGGIHVASSATAIEFRDVTVTGNAASTTSPGSALGGGIHASGQATHKVTFTNATIAQNASTGSPNATEGNLHPDVNVQLGNTLITGGSATGGGPSCGATATSLGHNLEDTTPSQCGLLVASGDLIGVSPLLGPLQDNGGPSPTAALLAGSPAIDAATLCSAADQRGIARQGAACDIGAYELAPGAATTSPAGAVGSATALLAGTATNPDGLPGSITFQYGTTAAYGLTTAAQSVAAGTTAGPFVAGVAGLAPATTHHFRAVATNAAGTTFGADQTFVTAPAPIVAPPKTVAPALGKLALSRKALRPDPARSTAASRKAAKRRPTGATLSYTDTQKATTTITVLRGKPGVRVGTRCLAKRPSTAKGKPRRCTRFVAAGKLTHADAAGKNSVRITGRLGGKALAAGSYRFSAVARNSARQSSAPRTLSFRVVR
jgi:hypothetical protein